MRIAVVADVRSVPRSSRFPWFERSSMAKLLAEAGMEYVWLGRDLGGRRQNLPGSPHVAIQPGMQGYADHMATTVFKKAVRELCVTARERRVAILCAERRPENCHRSFLCDYIVYAEGLRVTHVIDAGMTEPHHLSPCLRWIGDIPVYDRLVTGLLF